MANLFVYFVCSATCGFAMYYWVIYSILIYFTFSLKRLRLVYTPCNNDMNAPSLQTPINTANTNTKK